MGSGFRTFQASEVLTSSNVQNYLMDQAVTVHGGTAALATAIPSPEAGMVAYVDSGDSSEGLYTHNGSVWRKGPGWNAPWGYVAHATQAANQTTSGTTELTITNTGSFTAVSNRYYLLTAAVSPYGSVGGDQFYFRVRNGSISGTQLAITTISVRDYSANNISIIINIAAGASNGLYLTFQRASGTGTLTSNATVSPATITLTDIGPSGAPV